VTTKTHATSTFTIDSWEQATWDEAEGGTLSRARVTKTFTGDLEGTSVAELLFAQAPVEESRAYVGFERVTGRLDGREGTFVLHHTAGASGISWTILPDSGTAALHSITGTAHIDIAPDGTHTLTLDYDIP
jgi:uncharacterized protein DUF3224